MQIPHLQGVLPNRDLGVLYNVAKCYDVSVHDLRLSICLRMVGGTHIQLCPQCFEEDFPKFRCEFGITVRHQCLGYAVMFEYGILKDVSNLYGRHVSPDRYYPNVLG